MHNVGLIIFFLYRDPIPAVQQLQLPVLCWRYNTCYRSATTGCGVVKA